MRYQCDCCGYYCLRNQSDDICHVCGWQEDNVQRRDPDFTGGANEVSLNEQKEIINCLEYLAKNLADVRTPLPEEFPENNR